MSLQSPNLDDRTFTDLVEAAKLRIRQHCPEWNNLNAGDPGIVLLETFAFLTETMLYRLNKVPDKAYIEFLKLIGVQLIPPSAAYVTLEFKLSKPSDNPVEIPKKTRVTGTSNDAPIFILAESATIAPGDHAVIVNAYHCDQIEGELLGLGSGLPGLSLPVKNAPIIASTADHLDLVIGVEAASDELETRSAAIKFKDKTYRVWQEVENFSQTDKNSFAYLTDRHSGLITFAPSIRKLDASNNLSAIPEALAAIPPAGREIRAWYRYGGGSKGNVSASSLTVLKDPIVGISVTNPKAATGGRDGESLQNALIRGPQELHSLSRAVTARDFELIAIQNSGAINRAKAFTQVSLWQHAIRGAVEVTIVPDMIITPDNLDKITASAITDLHHETVREQIQKVLDIRRPLGTHCIVNWGNYKQISIRAEVIIHPEENPQQVRERILNQLYRNICPLKIPEASVSPWPFGQSIKAWDIYKIIGSEPAVISVESMQMITDAAPSQQVKDLCSDAFQPDTWYAGNDEKLFRTTNNGDSWELIAEFTNEKIQRVLSFSAESCIVRSHPGIIAATTKITDHISAIKISKDCGQTWITAQQFQFLIEDFVWLERNGLPYLILATEKGLYELNPENNAVPKPILVDPKLPEFGFRAITVSTTSSGKTVVAVAGYENKGVYLSFEGGQSDTFKHVGLAGELIEALTVQHKGPHRYIWAGIGAPGPDQGKGCFRWTLSESIDNPEGWKSFGKNWQAGGCKSIAINGPIIFAASYRLGVLRLNTDLRDPSWEALNPSCGLPLRDVDKLETIDTVASDYRSNLVMAGSVSGIYRSLDLGLKYATCSQREFTNEIKIPPNWLFYSGPHEIDISFTHEA